MMHVWMKSLVDGLSYYGDLGHSLETVLRNPVSLKLLPILIEGILYKIFLSTDFTLFWINLILINHNLLKKYLSAGYQLD